MVHVQYALTVFVRLLYIDFQIDVKSTVCSFFFVKIINVKKTKKKQTSTFDFPPPNCTDPVVH